MNEFEHTLNDILARHGVDVMDLAEQTGFAPPLVRDIVAGKSRQVPVDFFLRIAQALNLSEEEKDALIRSWAFGAER